MQDQLLWTYLLHSGILLKFIFNTYVNLRQYFVLDNPEIPALFSGIVSQNEYNSSRLYTQSKIRHTLLEGFWNLLVLEFLIHFEILSLIWEATSSISPNWRPDIGIGQSIVFALIYQPINTLLYLPMEAVETFYVETVHGFNNQSVKQFLKDRVLVVLINSILIAIVLPIGLLSVETAGNAVMLYATSLVVSVNLIVALLNPIIQSTLFYKATPLPDGALREMVTSLTSRLDFPLDKISVFNGSTRSSHSNAMMYGLPWQKILVVEDSLLGQMSDNQVVAVIAHELAHWKHWDTLKQFIFYEAYFLPLFGLFSVAFANPAFYSALGFDASATPLPIIPGLCIFWGVLGPLDILYRLFLNRFLRRFEFQADQFALNIGFKDSLCDALIVLLKENKSPLRYDWLYSMYYSSHPSMGERLEALGWKPKAI